MQRNDGFDVLGVREHIDGPDALRAEMCALMRSTISRPGRLEAHDVMIHDEMQDRQIFHHVQSCFSHQRFPSARRKRKPQRRRTLREARLSGSVSARTVRMPRRLPKSRNAVSASVM